MSEESRPSSPTGDATGVRTTFAVQFVFEVETQAVAERVRGLLPGPDPSEIEAEGYRSYVDTAGLARPAVGASVPCRDRATAEELYRTIGEADDVAESVRAGTLAVRRFEAEAGKDGASDEPVVVEVTRYP